MSSNQAMPAGYRMLAHSAITPQMTAWVVEILRSPSAYPMFAMATRVFGNRQVLARVEWHPPDILNHAQHRGVSLYEASPTASNATAARGIDVSHCQAQVDFEQARVSGLSFVFMKATEATELIDPVFAKHWASAKQAGLLRGAYHFFRPRRDALSQARLFLAQLGDPGELPPALDVELADGMSPAQVVAGVTAWVDFVSARLGRPLIYTAPGFWNALPDTACVARKADLWVAHWGAKTPDAVRGWANWTFWQRTNKAIVPGIPMPVDEDCFDGSFAQLRSYSAAVFAERATFDALQSVQSSI